MQDERLTLAMDAFVTQRINDFGAMENENLHQAYEEFWAVVQQLQGILDRDTFIDFENAQSLLDGETMNCYYRAGFGDGVQFLMNWRDGRWN